MKAPQNKELERTRSTQTAVGPRRSIQCSTDRLVCHLRRLLAMACLFPLVGCDGGTTVKGHIQSLSGDPLGGATVRLLHRRTERQVNTGSDGSFRVGFLHEPGLRVPVRLVVSMPKHQVISIDLFGTAQYECTIRMPDDGGESKGALVLAAKEVCRKIER